jgi:hypothetical protein
MQHVLYRMFLAIFKGSLCVAEDAEPERADHPGSTNIAGACRFSRSGGAFCPTMLALGVTSPDFRFAGVVEHRPLPAGKTFGIPA